MLDREIAIRLGRETFASYDEAARIAVKLSPLDTPADSSSKVSSDVLDVGPRMYPSLSFTSLVVLSNAVTGLLWVMAAPYLSLFGVVYYCLRWQDCLPWTIAVLHPYSHLTCWLMRTVFLCAILTTIRSFISTHYSVVTGLKSRQEFGATVKQGLYAAKSLSELLKKCPIITSSEAIEGGLPGLPRTPWLWSGHTRTLLPFVTFHPPVAHYSRRWVRVPISPGRENPAPSQPGGLTEDHMPSSSTKYEAVALDWAAPAPVTQYSEDGQPLPPKVILLLAGLTGGSSEGYVLDFVQQATTQNWHVFVMIGRGLGGTPLHSGEMFHGARVSDMMHCAAALRKVLGTDAKLCVAGVSLGGIITLNASLKHNLFDFVDGAASIAGSFDSSAMTHFTESRKWWQPLLAFSLKHDLVSPQYFWKNVERVFGKENAIRVMDGVDDVHDFDMVVMKNLHGFDSVLDYYDTMCGNRKCLFNKESKGIVRDSNGSIVDEDAPEESGITVRKPLLAIHALDDPIIHVDMVATKKGDPTQPIVLGNMALLLTRTGGHIGWPVGWMPWVHGFKYQNSVTLEFLDAVSYPSKK